MGIVKYIGMEVFALVAMLMCSTAVMKILSIVFQLNYENVWAMGFKVGFIAWLVLSVVFFATRER